MEIGLVSVEWDGQVTMGDIALSEYSPTEYACGLHTNEPIWQITFNSDVYPIVWLVPKSKVQITWLNKPTRLQKLLNWLKLRTQPPAHWHVVLLQKPKIDYTQILDKMGFSVV